MLLERQRLLYVYLVVDKVLTLKASPNYEKVAFLLMKFNSVQAQDIKSHLLDAFHPEHFPSMRFPDNWSGLAQSREFA